MYRLNLAFVRPVGPGYDKGRTERRREEVDMQYRCDFFKWASDVKKEALRNGTKEHSNGAIPSESDPTKECIPP